MGETGVVMLVNRSSYLTLCLLSSNLWTPGYHGDDVKLFLFTVHCGMSCPDPTSSVPGYVPGDG